MSTKTQAQASKIIGTYLASGTIGNVGLPGAPISHFHLTVTPSTNSVSGIVEITQAIEGPESNIVIKNVTGSIRATGYGKVTKVVELSGEYMVSFPPPAIGSYLAKFSANMAIDDNWDGRGGFTYGQNEINDVPVIADNK